MANENQDDPHKGAKAEPYAGETDTRQASLERRLAFAGSWQHRTDLVLARLKIACPTGVGRVADAAAQLAFDAVELVRAGGQLRRPGQVYKAAFDSPARLPQHPRYRGYWYDEREHILIGMHLGLDILRSDNRYHLVECNTHPAMRPERRALYPEPFDPIIANLAALARRFGFERVVFHRARAWSKAYLDELAAASRETGIEFTGASLPFVHATKRPGVALPDRLRPRTIYVGNWGHGTPISLFMHDKARVGQWLEETLADQPDPASLLASIPTFDRICLPAEPPAPCWPNLVIKLANADGGEFVQMGRFESEVQARQALGLDTTGGGVPRFFRRGLLGSLLAPPKVVYQPFIPPETVGRRARLIRAHVFISPLTDELVSAHGVLAGKDLPDRLPPGLVTDRAPYVVNFSNGSSYMRLEPAIEEELVGVTRRFGQLAKLAIGRKFRIGPEPAMAPA